MTHLRVPFNTEGGRDFIVGDLHGCLHAFYDKLWEIGFDTKREA